MYLFVFLNHWNVTALVASERSNRMLINELVHLESILNSQEQLPSNKYLIVITYVYVPSLVRSFVCIVNIYIYIYSLTDSQSVT